MRLFYFVFFYLIGSVATNVFATSFDELFHQLKMAPEGVVNTCASPGGAEIMGCKKFYDSMCTKLYDKDHQGNLTLPGPLKSYEVKLGQDKNGFSQSGAAFQQAKMAAIQNKTLPEDFLKNLPSTYVTDLQAYLDSKPYPQMSQADYEAMSESQSRSSVAYSSAFEKTVRDRVNAKIPGFYTTRSQDRTLAEKNEAARIEDELSSAVYKGIWQKNDHYLNAVKQFEALQKTYLDFLEHDASLRADEKSRLKNWISTVKMKMPGEDPDNIDDECDTTEENARYFSETHTLTVCAGEFNALPGLQFTMAHELTHALGMERTKGIAIKESSVGKAAMRLVKKTCEAGEKESCPREWSEFLAVEKSFPKVGKNYPIPFENYRACLQLHSKDLHPINNKNGTETASYLSYLNEQGDKDSKEWVSNRAEQNVFIDLVLKQIPVSSTNADLKENPQYLNPCANSPSLDISSLSIKSNVYAKAVFSAAYRCSKGVSSKTKMTEAINQLRYYYKKIDEQSMRFGKNLSTDESSTLGNYSEDTEERFADSLGNQVFAKYIRETIPEGSDHWQENRRNLFFANVPDFCDEISSRSVDSGLTDVQDSFMTDAHSSDYQRRLDLLNPPMDQVLGCKKEKNAKECK